MNELKVPFFLDPPYIEILPNQIDVQEGLSTSLICPVKHGYPRNTSILWFSSREDAGIISHNRFLFVKNVTKLDAGVYTCVASNHVFNTTYSLVLKVTGKLIDFTCFLMNYLSEFSVKLRDENKCYVFSRIRQTCEIVT